MCIYFIAISHQAFALALYTNNIFNPTVLSDFLVQTNIKNMSNSSSLYFYYFLLETNHSSHHCLKTIYIAYTNAIAWVLSVYFYDAIWSHQQLVAGSLNDGGRAIQSSGHDVALAKRSDRIASAQSIGTASDEAR